jgi:WD40 repeat protein
MQITRVHACTGHRAAVYALARGGDDRHFLTAAGDGWVVEWNLDDLETGKLIASTETQLFSLCALPDQQTILAGNMNGGLHWIVRDKPEQNRNILHHKKGIYDILALGKYVFTAGGDGLFTRWDMESARTLESIQLSSQALRAIAYSDKNHEIAVGASDNNIYFLDADTLELKSTIQNAHTNSVFTLAWSPDQTLLLSGGRDAWLRIWEYPSATSVSHPALAVQTPKEAAHLFTLNHIAFSPDGQLFATASRDKTIKIWDGQSGELLKVIDTIRHGGHINSVNRLLWVADCLVSASDDRSAMVWRVEC